METVIIGAGIAGASLARLLSNSERKIRIFDKARGPGGRMSTRREESFSFDHGAQYFTVRTPEFAAFISSHLKEHIALWPSSLSIAQSEDHAAELKEDHKERYVTVPGMNHTIKTLLKDLDVSWKSKAKKISKKNKKWNIEFEDSLSVIEADELFICIPAPQAMELLKDQGKLHTLLKDASYNPCFSLMLGFKKALDVEFKCLKLNSGPLKWCAHNNLKPGRDGDESWILQSSFEFAEKYIDRKEEALLEMKNAAKKLLHFEDEELALERIHFWRYASVKKALNAPCTYSKQEKIGLCGDYFIGRRIEDAFLSAYELSKIANKA